MPRARKERGFTRLRSRCGFRSPQRPATWWIACGPSPIDSRREPCRSRPGPPPLWASYWAAPRRTSLSASGREDLDRAYQEALDIQAGLASLESVGNVRIAQERGVPQVQIEILRDQAARFGIDPRRVAETLEQSNRGNFATEFVDFDRKIDVVVRFPDELRYSLESLDKIRVDGIPIRELITVREALAPSEVNREDQGRVTVVHADVIAGGLAAAIADVEAAVASLPREAGVRVEVGGENEEMRRSFRDLSFAFGLALLLVYMILAAQFESLTQPFTILVAVPLALVGAIAALGLTGQGLNTMSLIGVVILVGIVVNDAIVKVEFINQSRARGSALREAILEAGHVRLRPIVMTTVTTVLGLLPMALGLGRGADLRAPLAIAVIGGLIVATMLTLIVVPVIYSLIEGARGGWGRSEATPQEAGSVIKLAIRRPVAVAMAYLAVALLGVASWQNIPIELLPDTELPKLTINAGWRGASPETVEAFLTSPIESTVQQVRGVDKVTSISMEQNGLGWAQVDVEFDRDVDMDFTRLDLSERLAALQEELPPTVLPIYLEPYVPEEFSDQARPFLSYTYTGPFSLEALRRHLEDEVVPRLAQIEGVATVEISGGRDRLIDIELDPERIAALGLDPQFVSARISELDLVREAGAVRDGAREWTLTIRNRPASVEDIRSAVITAGGSGAAGAGTQSLVRVSDVATVRDGFEEARRHQRIDGRPAVQFFLIKSIGANTVRVADQAKAAVEDAAAYALPNTRFILDDDESREIRRQLSDLRSRALVSAGVIFCVLLIFLGSLSSAAVIFATIGFSILIALNLVYFGGFTLNLLTLMGLAMGFGLIVDNSIVVLENTYRRWRGGDEPEEAALHGSREVVLPILASTATTLIVFVPFVYLQGELRVFYVPLAIVVGFTLLASLAVAFSFIPALASRVLRRERGGRSGRGRLLPARAAGPPHGATGTERSRRTPPLYTHFYAFLIRNILRWPGIAVALTVLALGGSYYLFDSYVTRGRLWGGGLGPTDLHQHQLSPPARLGSGAYGRAGAVLRGPAEADARGGPLPHERRSGPRANEGDVPRGAREHRRPASHQGPALRLQPGVLRRGGAGDRLRPVVLRRWWQSTQLFDHGPRNTTT